MIDPVERPNRLLIVLSIVFSALTITTVGLGISTIVLLNGRAGAAAQPTPTPTPTAAAATGTTTIDGFEISAATDLAVERLALAVVSHSDQVNVYAVLTNENRSEAADAVFDVTSYREDGSIVDRGLDIVYIPPGDSSVLQVELPEDLSDVVSIVIEQTRVDWLPPVNGGTLEVASVEASGLPDLLDVQLTSQLDLPAENTLAYLFAYDGEELIGICEAWGDLPATGGAFEDLCTWAPTPVDDPVMGDALPEDTEFEAYVRLEAPEG